MMQNWIHFHRSTGKLLNTSWKQNGSSCYLNPKKERNVPDPFTCVDFPMLKSLTVLRTCSQTFKAFDDIHEEILFLIQNIYPFLIGSNPTDNSS